MKFQIEATQWFKNGDHPKDNCQTFYASGRYSDMPEGTPFQGEGKVVRYFRDPSVDGQKICERCGQIMHVHGWIDQHPNSETVCPGMYVITTVNGYDTRTAEEFEYYFRRLEELA